MIYEICCSENIAAIVNKYAVERSNRHMLGETTRAGAPLADVTPLQYFDRGHY